MVNTCIEAGYAGVGQGKLERWQKFDGPGSGYFQHKK